jgi:hypothetical protein
MYRSEIRAIARHIAAITAATRSRQTNGGQQRIELIFYEVLPERHSQSVHNYVMHLQSLVAGGRAMHIRRFAAIAAVSLFAGCAIHPLPEDVTGVDTAGIVKQIRCETRNAARNFILRELRRLAQDLPGDPGDPIAKRLLADYEVDQELMSTFSPNLFPAGRNYAQVRNYFNAVYNASVAYNFDLTMTEVNNLGANANFLGPWAATFTLGLTGNANRSRQNERTFTISDELSFLLGALNTPAKSGQRYCDGHIALGPNYIYPIVGRIGVDEMVNTFFQLNIFENLAPGKDNAAAMADKLTFTTTVDLTAMPRVVFAPAATGFQITDASLTGMLQRMDAHQVTVGLALDPKGTVAVTALRGFVFSGQGLGTGVAGGRQGGSSVLVLNRVTATATSRAARLALQAVDQLKSREVQLIAPPP